MMVDLFNNNSTSKHEVKLDYIARIDAYSDILNLVKVFKEDIERREKTEEMLRRRQQETQYQPIVTSKYPF